jgi:type IV pilus assembly protein PilE
MMHHLNPTPRTRGFTLLELMLVVVVIAILATVAVPTYSEFVQRSRRSDAREALSDLAARQEQFFLNNKYYASTTTVLGQPALTDRGFYNITIPTVTTVSFTLRATALSPQDQDTDCAVMAVTSTGVRTPAACW